MLYLQLFLTFCQIGFTSFGGMSMVPLINQQMVNHGWMTVSEVADLVAIAEMTPGPLGLNIATFCGLRLAGFAGSFCATMGMLSPTFTVGVLVGIFYVKFRSSTFMKRAMYGIRPVCIGLILSVIISLAQTNYILDGKPYISSILIAAVTLVLMKIKTVSIPFTEKKLELSIPILITIAAILGLIIVR